MLSIAFIAIIALYIAFLFPIFKNRKVETPRSARYDMQMKKLWNAAQI